MLQPGARSGRPTLGQDGGLHAGIARGLGQPIEAVVKVTHETMPVAHRLGAFELLEAEHTYSRSAL